MTVQSIGEAPRSLWGEQAARWLDFKQTEASPVSIEQSDEDHNPDPDPPPIAPAMRPWPRIFPGL